jgi:hypothetical protein
MELGMCLFSTTDTSLFDSYVDDLIKNNITCLRVDIPNYQDAAILVKSKAAVIRAIAKGASVVWGVSSNKYSNPAYEITAANWNDYKAGVLAAAAWAEANGVYEFQIGNEEEEHIDGTTLTMAQLRDNLRNLATEVKLVFTRGNISYSTLFSLEQEWVAEGKGDIDIISINVYHQTADDETWFDYVKHLVDNFGVNGTYVTEFSLNNTSLDTYSSDENIQSTAIFSMISKMQYINLKRAHFFAYIGDNFGAYKADGTYRKLWELLKITNNWKLRKTASKSGLGGLSHG